MLQIKKDNIKKNYYQKLFFQILIYLLGSYFFGLSITLYLDLNLGAIHEDVFVFAFIYLLNWNHNQDYFVGLLLLYLFYFIIIFFLRIFKVFHLYQKTELNWQIWKKEIILLLLDLIPMFLWPLSEKFNALFINSTLIGNYDVWVRYWILLASYAIFCLSMSLIIYSKILYGPYNNLSLLLSEIFNFSYTKARILIDVLITVVGIILIFSNNAGLTMQWNNFKNWISLATVFVTFFSGSFINYLVNLFNKCYSFDLIKNTSQVVILN